SLLVRSWERTREPRRVAMASQTLSRKARRIGDLGGRRRRGYAPLHRPIVGVALAERGRRQTRRGSRRARRRLVQLGRRGAAFALECAQQLGDGTAGRRGARLGELGGPPPASRPG